MSNQQKIGNRATKGTEGGKKTLTILENKNRIEAFECCSVYLALQPF